MARTLLASSLILICCFASLAYRWHRLCHIPGPFWTSFLPRRGSRRRFGCLWPLDLRRASDQCGGLIRVGPNQLVTSDIDAIIRINSPSFGYSGVPASSFQDRSHCSFSCPEGKKCSRQAAPCGYKGDSQLEAIADRQCDRLIRLIGKEFASTKVASRPLEMNSASRWLVSNILGDLMSSGPCASLEEGEGRCNMSGVRRSFLSRIVAALLPVRMTRACRCHFDSDKVPGSWDEHELAQHHHKTDLCEVDEEVTKRVPDELRDWAHLTADALTTVILYLLTSPAAYHKLKTEIIGWSVLQESRFSTAPVPRALPPPPGLPYLRAVVKEGCRMSEAVGTVPPVYRRSPKMVDTISDFQIPGGTEIGPDFVGIMRAKKHWGNGAEVFRPERWLEANDEETRLTMERALDILWGGHG
ncbi:hypothetical protein PG993_002463 [Apiospora rasikravindrae]|uniref:Cytochrome P450 n=1 Tax=Apiospora rasikravindrae TaxID=990691 RepID=A0ABR1TZD6_9PEZI